MSAGGRLLAAGLLAAAAAADAATPVTRVWTTMADFAGGEGYAAGATLWSGSATDGYLTLFHQQEYSPDPTSNGGNWWSRDKGQGLNWRIVRWDAAGNQAFAVDYNSPASADDSAAGVALLPGGGFIAAGSELRPDIAHNADLRIRRYDDLGALLSEFSYDDPVNSEDRVGGVAVDPAGGTYAVAGFENRGADLSQSWNAILRIHDPAGAPVGSASWNGPDNLADEFKAVAFNAKSGGWAAAGSTTRNTGGLNWLVARYNATGGLLWSTEYAGAGGGDEVALGVATSPVNGNIVVAGYEDDAALGQGRDWLIRTYTAAGGFVSRIGCDAPLPSQDDGATAAALDIAKNSWVAGWENRSDAGEGDNMLLRQYDAAGALERSLSVTGPVAGGDDRALAVALTRDGGAVMAGYEDTDPGAGADTRWRVVLVGPPIAATLDKLWSTSFDGPVPGGDDRAAAVAGAPSNSVYVAGWMDFGAPYGQDWVVKQINYAGTKVLWTRTLDGVAGAGGGEDRALGAVTAKPSTSVYVVGYVTDTLGGTGANWMIRQFGLGGTVMLELGYDGAASLDDRAYAVGIDAKGYLYVAGVESTSPTDTNWLVRIINPATGALVNSVTYDTGPNSLDEARSISVMPNGSFFVAGIADRTDLGEGRNWLVRGYDSAGTQMWERTFNAPPNLDDAAMAISASNFTAGGRVVIAGSADRSDLAAGLDWRIEWTTTSGGALLTTSYASASCLRDEQASAVAVDAAGNIIAGGWEDRSDLGEGRNWTLRKYSAAGAELWRASYNADLGDDDEISAVGVDAAGDVYAAGFAQYAGRGEDLVVRKYDPNGLLLWHRQFNGVFVNAERALGLAVNAAGDVTVAGQEDRADTTDLTRLPFALVDHATVRVGDRIYVIGGTEKVSSPCVSGGLTQCVPYVRFSRIDSAGALGPWTRAFYPFGVTGPAAYPFGPPLTPSAGISIVGHKAVAVGNRIYVVGGSTNCAAATPPFTDVLDTVYSVEVDPVTGQTGPWREEIGLIKAGRAMALAEAGGALFALGGATNASNAPTQGVQKAEIDPSGRLYSSSKVRWDGSMLALPVGAPSCPGNNLCAACSPAACVPCTNPCVISANECLGWLHMTAFSMMHTIAFVGAGYQSTLNGTPCTIFNGAVYGWLGDDNKPVSWQTGAGSVPLVDAQAYSTPIIGNGTVQFVGGSGGSGSLTQVLYPPLGVDRGIFRTGGADGAELRPALPKTSELFAGLANPTQMPIAVKGVPGVVYGDYAYLIGGEHAGSPCNDVYRTRLTSTSWYVDAGYWLSPPYDLGTTAQLMRVAWSMSKTGAGIADDWAAVRYRVAGEDGVWSVWSPRIPETNAMPAAPGYYTYASDVPGNQPFFRMPVAPGTVRFVQYEVSLYNDNGGASDGGAAPTLPRFDEFRLTYVPVPPPPPLKPGCPLEAYPNPAKDRLTVRFEVAPEGGEVRLRVINAAAQIVGEEKYSYVAGGVVTEHLDLTGWAPGAYVILVDGVARGGDAALYCTESKSRFKRLKEKFVIRR